MSSLDRTKTGKMAVGKNRLQAAVSLGRDVVRMAVFALAGNPPQISVIVMSAVLGFLLDLLPARAAGIIPLQLE